MHTKEGTDGATEKRGEIEYALWDAHISRLGLGLVDKVKKKGGEVDRKKGDEGDGFRVWGKGGRKGGEAWVEGGKEKGEDGATNSDKNNPKNKEDTIR